MCICVVLLILSTAHEEDVNELVTRSSNLVFPWCDWERFYFILIFSISLIFFKSGIANCEKERNA